MMVGRRPSFFWTANVELLNIQENGGLKSLHLYPIPSMYGIITYMFHENQPNVGKYTIHEWIMNGMGIVFDLGWVPP